MRALQTEITTELALGQQLHGLDRLEGQVQHVIRQLPLRGPDGAYLVPDEAVRLTALTAQEGAKSLWQLSCAARAETVRRIAERAREERTIAREIAREAAEQHTSPTTFRRDAQIGAAYGPLFAAPDAAPDLDKTYYIAALVAPDPQAALQIAQQRKDQDPFYSTRDFEAEVAALRVADPVAGYKLSARAQAAPRRCGLALVWPYWEQGALEVAGDLGALPLGQWLLPDALVLLRAPPRALDLACRALACWDLRYYSTVLVETAPYLDAGVQHQHHLLVIGQRGRLQPPRPLPGLWAGELSGTVERRFPHIRPLLAVYPRWRFVDGQTWLTPDDL